MATYNELLAQMNKNNGGNQYASILPQPQQVTPNSTGNAALDALTNRYTNYGSFTYAPSDEVLKPYQDQVNAAYDKIANREEFSYNPLDDKLYGYYKQAYNREGDRATANALGQAAAASGGIPSSYAATAAAQAGNYYASQLADKIPDLYQQAYNRYMQEFNMGNTLYGDALSRYELELGRYNTDRNFAYGQYNDDYGRLGNQINLLTGQDDTAYGRTQAAQKDARDRIQIYLSGGGNVANLPPELLASSGLTNAELQTWALLYAPALGGGYVGDSTNAEEPEAAAKKGLSNALYKPIKNSIMKAAETNKDNAIAELLRYSDKMTNAQFDSALSAINNISAGLSTAKLNGITPSGGSTKRVAALK